MAALTRFIPIFSFVVASFQLATQDARAETFAQCILRCANELMQCEGRADTALREALERYNRMMADAERNYRNDVDNCQSRYPNDKTLREQCVSKALEVRAAAEASAQHQFDEALAVHEAAKQACRNGNDECVGKEDPNGDGSKDDATGCQKVRFCTAPITVTASVETMRSDLLQDSKVEDSKLTPDVECLEATVDSLAEAAVKQ